MIVIIIEVAAGVNIILAVKLGLADHGTALFAAVAGFIRIVNGVNNLIVRHGRVFIPAGIFAGYNMADCLASDTATIARTGNGRIATGAICYNAGAAVASAVPNLLALQGAGVLRVDKSFTADAGRRTNIIKRF